MKFNELAIAMNTRHIVMGLISLLLMSSFQLSAQEPVEDNTGTEPVVQDMPVPDPADPESPEPVAEEVATESEETATESMNELAEAMPLTDTCPMDFHTLPLFPGASLCQLFDDALPATLTYHAKADQQMTRDFFVEQLGEANKEAMLKGRIVLEYQGGNQIIILSPDGEGTQVDVLVKA